MQSIVALFWRIAIFKAGPEAVPFSPFLAALLVILNIPAGMALLVLLYEATALQALAIAVASLASYAILVAILMRLLGFFSRFVQTFTALVGTDLLVSLIQAILAPVYFYVDQVIGQALLLGTALWAIAIFGFIFHRALNLHIGLGIGVAFLIVITTSTLTANI